MKETLCVIMMTGSWEWDKWHFFGSWRAPGTVRQWMRRFRGLTLTSRPVSLFSSFSLLFLCLPFLLSICESQINERLIHNWIFNEVSKRIIALKNHSMHVIGFKSHCTWNVSFCIFDSSPSHQFLPILLLFFFPSFGGLKYKKKPFQFIHIQWNGNSRNCNPEKWHVSVKSLSFWLYWMSVYQSYNTDLQSAATSFILTSSHVLSLSFTSLFFSVFFPHYFLSMLSK